MTFDRWIFLFLCIGGLALASVAGHALYLMIFGPEDYDEDDD